MAKDVGEEIVGAWLRLIQECDFVQYNVPTRSKQGEIDVIGLNLSSKTAYICEVATHTGGLQYTHDKQPDNVNKLTKKFRSDAEYGAKYLTEFKHRFMLWAPVVKHPTKTEPLHNQFEDLVNIRSNLWKSHQVEIEMFVNENYVKCLSELREKAETDKSASEYPVFRLLQIIHSAESHADQLDQRSIKTMQVIEKMENP